MLAGEGHRAPRSLLLRDSTHLMVDRVIKTEVLVDHNSQTALRRKIRIAHGILRAACCRQAEFCWPPRLCTACWRRAKQADCSWRRALGGWTYVALLLLLRFLAEYGTTGGRSRPEGGSGEERGEFDTQAIDRRF